MLTVLSAIVLVVGSIQATLVLSDSDRLAAEEHPGPIVTMTTEQAKAPSLQSAAE